MPSLHSEVRVTDGDWPVDKEQVASYNERQENAFNKVKDLALVQYGFDFGVIRLFFKARLIEESFCNTFFSK